MAFDLTCFTTRQPKSIAFISSAVGGLAETTCRFAFCEFGLIPFLDQQPANHGSHIRVAFLSSCPVSIFIRRRFFFFCSKARASGSNSGAMMTSLKISEMARASDSVSGGCRR